MNDEALNLVDYLDMLIDPVEPESVSLFPQTLGWAVVGGILLCLLAFFAWRKWRLYKANAYRRYALWELHAAGENPVLIADILRRTALVAYPRQQVASLSGKDWLQFLDARINEKIFATEQWQFVAVAPYREVQPKPGLNSLASRWIKHHRIIENSNERQVAP